MKLYLDYYTLDQEHCSEYHPVKTAIFIATHLKQLLLVAYINGILHVLIFFLGSLVELG